ncbi:ABC transporter permease [Petroclostridium sp. X23]|uniref:ABC transporter permease n=1 Tax=Petroclostridium sp. X23 TaxID=3045146 RepID=UPI0024AE64C0|nr:ABC transporter permease [Petroclostridium sp. X23]WHH61560.1 ABC transporter permease [Petroclostridium sp. X23]
MKKNKVPFNFQRFIAIIKKEFIQIRRDPFSMRAPIGMTIMMMVLFGYAVNTEVDHIATAVFDQSKTQQSREYIDKFESTQYFVTKYSVSSEDELTALLDSGRVKAGIMIPADFATDLKQNKSAQPLLVIDGTDPTLARTALNSGVLISNHYSVDLREKFLNAKGMTDMKAPGVELNTKVWYNPNMDNNKFTIPGLVGLILQNITVMLTAFAMVREKERGTIEQLIVTPIKSTELILAKLIPYIMIGYGAFLLALGICRWWFKVQILGNVFLLLLLGALFVICALAIGMLISTFARNQSQAMQLTMIIILPSVLLSGFVFPLEAVPVWIRPISFLIPLSYFMQIDRGIILKGIEMNYLWQDTLALVVFLTIILTTAIKRFKKSLD